MEKAHFPLRDSFYLSILSTLLPFLKIQHIRIPALSLRDQKERRDGAQDIAGKKYPQHIGETNN